MVVEGQLKLRIFIWQRNFTSVGEKSISKYFNCGHVSESIKSSNILKTFQLFYSYP